MDIIQRIAQLESEQIGERVYMGMSQKAKGGRGALGSPSPYGYRIVGGSYVIDASEAVVVREIFAQYVAGRSLAAIAGNLEARGVPTKKGGRWRRQTIAAILSNPLLCGRSEWDGIEAMGSHTAIIPEEVFDQVQREVAQRRSRKVLPRASTQELAVANP